ncbi:MAG: GNAT family N-acetyltransferase [Candidatus Nanopelagicaceae bacterium]|nr:GNAT family N-acetyltransferase [Candidatus Nanopelagicaceae bacterium]
MTEFFAREIATWTYLDEWSVYNSSQKSDLFTTEAGYLAVVGSEEILVGFACSGVEARVPGLSEAVDTLDVGLGMNPIFVGQRRGAEFGATVVSYFQENTNASYLRVVVQSWNERSLNLARNLGFKEIGVHECDQDGSFVAYTVLLKAVNAANS